MERLPDGAESALLGRNLARPVGLQVLRAKVRREHATTAVVLTPSQERALTAILAAPGCRIRDLAVATGVAHATATFQVQSLGRLGLLSEIRDGRDRRLFPAATDNAETYVQALLRDPKKRLVIEYIATAPARFMTLNQMARAIHVNFGFLKRTVEQLEATGFAHLTRRRHRYHVKVGEHLAEVLLRIQRHSSPGIPQPRRPEQTAENDFA